MSARLHVYGSTIARIFSFCQMYMHKKRLMLVLVYHQTGYATWLQFTDQLQNEDQIQNSSISARTLNFWQMYVHNKRLVQMTSSSWAGDLDTV